MARRPCGGQNRPADCTRNRRMALVAELPSSPNDKNPVFRFMAPRLSLLWGDGIFRYSSRAPRKRRLCFVYPGTPRGAGHFKVEPLFRPAGIGRSLNRLTD